MSRIEILEKIKSIIIENNPDKAINASMITENSELVRDLEFDSMQMVYTAVVLEKEFNCRIGNEGYRKAKTIGDIIDLILKKE